MADAERVRGEVFYIDQSCDHRGRVYGLPYFNYGRADHVRALFKFAHGAPITERGIWWLKVATANCYDEIGMSRRPFEERVAWTEKNLDRIRQVAADPWSGVLLYGEGRVLTEETVVTHPLLGPYAKGRPWLAAAKDPYQFLAHAIELVAALKEGTGFVTTLPIPFDASNSGAQHYALLMRDRRLAELTNLVDSDEPRDLYSEFGDHVMRLFSARQSEIERGGAIGDSDQQELHHIRWCERQELHERKAQKGFAVAWIYGSGDRRQKAALGRRIRKEFRVPEFRPGHKVLDAFGEPTKTLKVVRRWLPDDEVPRGMIKWFIERQYKAMEETAPSITKAMKFIQSLSRVLTPLEWVSPSGVPVRNLSWKTKTSALTLWLGSEKKPDRHVGAVGYEPEPDAGKTLRAGPPNLVHSMDASHLALVALACKRARIPLLTVHDSFATLPCYADKLREILLREMRKMHARDWLAELGPNRPPPGDLRIEDVRGRYAFG
jgi:DNA-dependent RNA polymerase